MTVVSEYYFLPLLLAAKRARSFAVDRVFAPCGVPGVPNAGAGEGDANGLPPTPLDPAAKLNPPVGAGDVGAATVPKMSIRN